MKILAFTDIHSEDKFINNIVRLSKKENPDIVVCCGDISEFEFRLRDTVNRFKVLGKKLIIIPGNHESNDKLEKICNQTNFCVYLHRNIFEFQDFIFLGYGGMGFTFRDKDLEKFSENIIPKLKNKKIVLLTHAPPFNTRLDYLPWLEDHRGSKSITDLIKRLKPVLALSGHFHETFGFVDKINNSILINPGANGKIIKI